MAEKLTPQQKMAVEDRGGQLLVSAAAGSGKTKVLVDRLLSYIMDPNDPANIDDFLIITYTKAAAAELRSKIADKLTQRISEQPGNRHLQNQMQRLYLAKISTVHAYCAELLREYAYKLDIPSDFRIAEENECLEIKYRVIDELLDEAYANVEKDQNFAEFVNSQGLGRDDRLIPEILLQVYSSAMCHVDPTNWLEQCATGDSLQNISDVSQTPWGEYLIMDLRRFLELQIKAIDSCIASAEAVDGMEKPSSLLKDTVFQLKQLAACTAWDEIVRHPPVQFGTLSFKKEHRGSDLAEQIKAIRGYCKESLAKKLRVFTDTSDKIIRQSISVAKAEAGLVSLVKRFMLGYGKVKNSKRILDFNDIEQMMLDLLLGKSRGGATAAAAEIGIRFREIMVDEYQDSNEVQDAIFSALSGRNGSRFMVGDVKQSIYQFRLADPGIFLGKYHRFVPAENAIPGQGRKILLSSNFRSSEGVISAVNDVFSLCMSPNVGGLVYDEKEMLREGIPHVDLPETEVELYGVEVENDTYSEEASFVSERIAQLLDGSHLIRQGDSLRKIEPSDIVILLRSPGSVGNEFRYALDKRGIRCTMGSGNNLLQEPEVEVLCAFLQIISNPLQDIPLLSVLTSPVFGFTADMLAKIRGKNKKISIYESLCCDHCEKTENFIRILSDLRMDARFYTVTQLIDRVFIKTGMRNIYCSMDDGDVRDRNLYNFCQLVADFESRGRKDLAYFLEHLEALEINGFDSPVNEATENSVRIMSIHKSKGLEFPVVFLSGLSRRFNTSDTKNQVLCHKHLGLGLCAVNEKQRVRYPTVAKRAIATKILEDAVSEELRVLYVGMTRARDRLIMTYADNKLTDKLHDLAMRMKHSDPDIITAGASCPGTWVLYAAMHRTEAGEFFRLAGYPDVCSVSDIPWKIQVVSACQETAGFESDSVPNACLSVQELNKIKQGLSFRYAYTPATSIPSKLTATQLKGRIKDAEISENTNSQKAAYHAFRDPNFFKSAAGTAKGTASHTLLQYIRFDSCTDRNAVTDEIDRLVNANLIDAKDAKLIDVDRIVAFFQSPIGTRLRNAKEVVREFKFSILEEATLYYADSKDEKVLLQGVVDCAFIEDDGIVVIDFKTDFVTEQTLPDKINSYRDQVNTYARALSRIFEMPVKEAYLYFFHSGTLAAV